MINSAFEELKESYIPEQKATLHLYRHKQSQATIAWLENEDENRTFGMGFFTPPMDSTGVPHILEHAVLSGSRKYPVKDPFMEMEKASMNTFLNAMTFSDMTAYPISSMNEEDFHHLMDVYLDAVLFPNVLLDEKVFLQEGWHEEVNEDGKLQVNGVVMNEMRGVYSEPEATVEFDNNRLSHPNTPYEYESGGYPFTIKELTYEAFKAFHKRYYHPENSLTVLYGKIDIDRTLTQLNDGFLDQFTASKGKVSLDFPDFEDGIKHEELPYNGDEQTTAQKDSYFTYTLPFATSTSAYERLFAVFVGNLIVEAESSPLRRRLIDEGYAEDLSFNQSDGFYQDFSLTLEHVDSSRREEIESIIDEELEKIAKQGINPRLFNAVWNAQALQMRQMGGTMRGVSTFIQLLGEWRYDLPLEEGLHFNDLLDQLKEDFENGKLDQRLRDSFISPEKKVVLVHFPQVGFFDNLREEEGKVLQAQAIEQGESFVQQVKAKQEALLTYQQTPDTPENLKTIPQLKVSDIDKVLPIIQEERLSLENGGVMLYHNQEASGLRYYNFAFPLTNLSQEEYQIVDDLALLLGELDTSAHDYQELEMALNEVASGVSMAPSVYRNREDGTIRAYFNVNFYSLSEKSKEALGLIFEILKYTLFDDVQRVLTLLKQEKSAFESKAEATGHQVAMERIRSTFSKGDRLGEEIQGISHYDQLAKRIEHFEEEKDTYLASLKALADKIFVVNIALGEQAIVSVSADEEEQSAIQAELEAFFKAFPKFNEAGKEPHVDLLSQGNEAITSSGNVQYVAEGRSLEEIDESYNGKLLVLGNIMSNDILYQQLRIQAGAYGQGFSVSPTGLVVYSYRDPHLRRTLKVYEKLPELLEQAHYTQEDIERFIIGTMTRYLAPTTPLTIARLMLKRYLTKTTSETIQRHFEETLSTTAEDLPYFKGILEKLTTTPHIAVYGNDDHVQQQADKFDSIRKLKK